MRTTKRTGTVCTALVLLLLRTAEARQSDPAQDNPVWHGEPGVVRTVGEIMASAGAQNPSPQTRTRPKGRIPKPGVSNAPSPSPLVTAALPQPLTPQTVGTNWLGAQASDSGFLPPDSMGAVGLTQFLVVVNGVVRVFDKQGNMGTLNTSMDNFFSAVIPGGSGGTSDPRVRFDRLTNRWFVTCITVDTPNRVLIAMSGDQSGGKTITATTDFTFFFFQQDLVGTTPNADTGNLADYDTLGIDVNALYIGANIFHPTGPTTFTFVESTGWVVQKSSLLSGGPIAATAFRGIADGTGTGLITPQGVDNDDPAATQGFFIGNDGTLRARRVSNPGGAPSISGNLNISGVPAWAAPLPIPALGVPNTNPLDPVDDRLMMAHIYGGSLWTAHAINVTSSGAATGSGGTTGRTASRWYQIGNLGGTPSVSQVGTVFDPTVVTSGTARHYWIPSVAVSGQGHMAIGFSVAAPTNSAGTQIRPSVGVTGRLATDPAGTTQAVTIAATGSGNYSTSDNPQRWGDFSYTSVDPTDNMTMWTVQEYVNTTNSWGVRVVKLVAPPPAAPASASPNIVSPGTPSVQVVITGSSSAGSAFFEPGAGFPNHFTASVSPGGITVNSATVTDGTHVTLDLNVAAGAAVGFRDITLTNPDGQSVVLSAGISVETGSQPKVLSVNSSTSNGTYGVGTVIPITVTFNMAVNVTGTPKLTLETGAVDEVLNYISGSGTATLNFGYSVVAGDTSADLDVVSTNSLVLNGGDVRSAGFVEADLTLPVPGTVGSLSANKSLVIDTSAPDTTITSNPNALSNSTDAVFDFSSTEPAGATFEVSIDGAAFVSNGASTTITYSGLSQGAHSFKVRASDSASPKNVDPTPATFNWTIDSVPPDTQITAQPPDPDTNLTPTFNYTSTEAGSTFEYRVDGGAWTSTGTTGTVTLPSQFGGTHTFEVRATDTAGNVDPTPAQYTWSIPNGPLAPSSSSSSHHHGGCGLVGLEAAVFALLAAAVRPARRRD